MQTIKREIRNTFDINHQAFTVTWILHYPTQSISFSVRMPTAVWHYYLPLGIDIHSDVQTHEYLSSCDCNLRPSGKCYCDGSSTAGEELWEKFKHEGNEELIWEELERWANR